MKNIVDQYNGDASYTRLYDLVRDKPLVREVLKTASFEGTDVEELPSTAFAWPGARRYPIHTKEDAIASILYSKEASVPQPVEQALADAAEAYGLDAHLFATTKEAVEAATSEFVFPAAKRLPINSADEVKMAEEVLCRDFQRLSLDTRADAFSKLASAADKHQVKLSSLSERLAGITQCSVPNARVWIEARAAVAEGTVKQAYDNLSASLSGAPAVLSDRKDLVKLAAALAELDSRAGLERYYDRKLPDPILTVFNMGKRAEESVDLGGTSVPVSYLLQLDPMIWDQLGIPEIKDVVAARDTAQLKQILDTLPLDLKMVLAGSIGGE